SRPSTPKDGPSNGPRPPARSRSSSPNEGPHPQRSYGPIGVRPQERPGGTDRRDGARGALGRVGTPEKWLDPRSAPDGRGHAATHHGECEEARRRRNDGGLVYDGK